MFKHIYILFFLLICFVMSVEAKGGGWKEVNKLIDVQQYQAAQKKVDEIYNNKMSDERDKTLAIVFHTRLEIALHGQENAILWLKNNQWPVDPTLRSIVGMYYAQTLKELYNAYAWEINRREKLNKKSLTPKEWTTQDIAHEIQNTYQEIWKQKDLLGGVDAISYKDMLKIGEYPSGIRDTLRDLLVYEWVEFLNNSVYWTPAESNYIYSLNIVDMIQGKIVLPQHPLERISNILGEHKKWLSSVKKNESAMEAQAVLMLSVFEHLQNEQQKRDLLKVSSQLVEAFDNLPWKAKVLADLASLYLRSGSEDNESEAYRVANNGFNLAKSSFGGEQCQAIMAQILAPFYELKNVKIDSFKQETLQLKYKNLTRIYLRAYQINLKEKYLENKNYGMLNYENIKKEILQDKKPDFIWSEDLAEAKKFKITQKELSTPINKKGSYIIFISAKENIFESKANDVKMTVVQFSDLIIARNIDSLGNLNVAVINGLNGEPLADVKVNLYKNNWQQGKTLEESINTNKNGEVVFKNRSSASYSSYVLIAEKGEDITIDDSNLSFYSTAADVKRRAALIFTDRSIYRPEHKIQWKVVAFEGGSKDEDFRVVAKTPLKIILYDQNHQAIDSEQIETNKYGSASGSFVIPKGKALGSWSLQVERGYSGYTAIRVEEYKAPTFEVSIDTKSGNQQLNSPSELIINANYYMGLPVVQGQVNWRIEREPVFPSYWFWCEWCNVKKQKEIIASGKEMTDRRGTAKIKFIPKGDLTIEDKEALVYYRFTLYVDITGQNGETVNANQEFAVGFFDRTAYIVNQQNYYLSKDKIDFKVMLRNLNGDPKSGSGKISLLKLLPPKEIATNFRWEKSFQLKAELAKLKVDKNIQSKIINHDELGEGVGEFSPVTTPGFYRIKYEGKDTLGKPIATEENILVVDVDFKPPLPFLALAKSSTNKVGDNFDLIVGSGITKQKLSYLIANKNYEIQKGIVDGFKILSLPITEKLRGGFTVKVFTSNMHTIYEKKIDINVPWENKKFDLKLINFKDHTQPGNKEKITIQLKPKIQGGDVELLAYMYDRSLDAIIKHNPATPQNELPSNYLTSGANFSQGQLIAFSLGGYEGFGPLIYLKYLAPTDLEVLSGYGIGGIGRRDGLFNGSTMAAAPMQKTMLKSMESDSASGTTFSDVSDKSSEAKPTREIVPRSNFVDGGIWFPHLLFNKKGESYVEFTVPDSLTSWNLWFHAIGTDFSSGQLNQELKVAKELMVRPYLPRFLRQGDSINIKVALNNNSDKEREVEVNLDFDGGHQKKKQNLKARSETMVEFLVKSPSRVGLAEIKITAQDGKMSDGEKRFIAVLPSRLELSQSRSLVLRNIESKKISFNLPDGAYDSHSLVITADGQLLNSILKAMPFIINYPYESADLFAYRYATLSIMEKLYTENPKIMEQARGLGAKRSTAWENWRADTNRKILAEETPWLIESEGRANDLSFINLLDIDLIKEFKKASYLRLVEQQNNDGGFPWYKGGASSAFISLWIAIELIEAKEFGADVPDEILKKTWRFIADSVNLNEIEKNSPEFLVFLNFAARDYLFAKSERQKILDYTFKKWKSFSPILKSALAMTLKQMNRRSDARLILSSIMDSAIDSKEEGVHWQREDKTWLWYNDNVESQVWILKMLMEIEPGDLRQEGLVQWLFMNKKLNQWKSPRATAKVLVALVNYLKKHKQLEGEQRIEVMAANKKYEFDFKPEDMITKKQISFKEKEVAPQLLKEMTFEQKTMGMSMVSATWHFATESDPNKSEGDLFKVSRNYFLRKEEGGEIKLTPLMNDLNLKPGDEVEVQLTINSRHPAEYVHLRDPRGAGLEPTKTLSQWRFDMGLYYYEEVRDSVTNFFIERLPQGEFTLKYRLRVSHGGEFRVGPAQMQSLYAPEFTAYSAGNQLFAR